MGLFYKLIQNAAMTTVLETTGIQPPTTAAAELTVPLSFFDILWLHFHPIRQLVFYDHPCSEADFLDTIVPNLKKSLSLTLNHYLPVAGNLLYPSDTEKSKPVFRYISGDAVLLKVAVSGCDFDELTGSHARDSDQFNDFSPEIPRSREEADYKIVPLIALQATLFPGRGICVGITCHHCLGDARSVVGFLCAWAEINRRGGDDEYLSRNGESLPLFDRSVLGDCRRIDEASWNLMRNAPLAPLTPPLPTNRVRASFTLRQSHITKLKNLVLSKNPDLAHISSFVVTVAYTWICTVKSAAAAVEEDNSEDKLEVLYLMADGRGRPNALVDPPVPLNYFGSCLGYVRAELEHKTVVAEGGFVAAVEAIASVIKNKIINKANFLSDLENQISTNETERREINSFMVSGSPKSDTLNVDFGWGKGRRLEVLSMDAEEYSMSLCNASDSGGGLVVGMSLPRERMDAFASIFSKVMNFQYSARM